MTHYPESKLTDHALEKLLRNLPREKASPAFLQNTLAALNPRPKKSFSSMGWVLVGACFTLFLLTRIFPSPASLPKAGTIDSGEETLAELNQLHLMSRELKELSIQSQQLPVLRFGDPVDPPYLLRLRNLAEVTSETTYASFKPTRSF